MEPCVLLAVPTFKFTPSVCLGAHLGQVLENAWNGLLKGVTSPPDFSVDEARNEAVATLLSDPGFTHIWFVDDDIVVPSGALGKLLAHDLPVVSGWYYDVNLRPVIFNLGSFELCPAGVGLPTEPFRVGGAGLGCTLVKREVFERLPQPWFRVTIEMDPQGRRVKTGEDVYFAEGLQKLGVPWVVDGALKCDHVRMRVF